MAVSLSSPPWPCLAGVPSLCSTSAKSRSKLGFHHLRSSSHTTCIFGACSAERFLSAAARRQFRQRRACRWQAKAFDVHEALSVQAARQQKNVSCDLCSGRGWMECDFCSGKKTDVPAKNGRIYRRCPSCRAAGVLICPDCKVYKCTTFPDGKDGGFEMD